MTDTLKALLFELRQHPAFRELLKAVEAPRMPRWQKGMDKDDFVFASGREKQHEMWLSLLTGSASQHGEMK